MTATDTAHTGGWGGPTALANSIAALHLPSLVEDLHEILASQLLVETEDHRRVLIDAGDVLSVLRKPGKN